MATTIWKGHLTFGLVSIPVKLYRAARAEKVSFRQLHAATGTRVRQALLAEPTQELDPEPELEEPRPLSRSATARSAPELQPLFTQAPGPAPSLKARLAPAPASPEPETQPQPREISRSELVKGYEYARDRYVTLTREELAAIAPRTAQEMQILEFVQLSEVDPIYYESSYYVAPGNGGERAYALLLEALRQSGFVGIAQMAMHNREHVVIVRPGRSGLVLHTMFYESEVRRDDEYRADVSAVVAKELDLAQLLIRNLAAPFEAAKYRDMYREKLDALIEAKIGGNQTLEAPAAKPTTVVNIMEALQRSLQTSAAPKPKPPAAERAPSAAATERASRSRSKRK